MKQASYFVLAIFIMLLLFAGWVLVSEAARGPMGLGLGIGMGSGGGSSVGDALLIEIGDYLLLENGDKLLLE